MKTYDYLVSYNIKPSVQRLAIMDYLLTHKTHPAIEEIYQALSDDIPTLSKTTVYNTLKLFVEHGAAQMLTIDEHSSCYDADTQTHAHFLCKRCNKIFDIPALHVEENVSALSVEGFQIEQVHQYFRGVCPACVEAENEKAN